MSVLWRGIIGELGSDDQAGENDTMGGALESLGNRWESLAKTLEVDQCGHQSSSTNVRDFDNVGNELLQGWDFQVVFSQELWAWRRGGELVVGVEGRAGVGLDDLVRLVSEVVDHLVGDPGLDELLQSSGLILWTTWVLLTGLEIHGGGLG